MAVSFTRCTSRTLRKVPIIDGQIIFVKDTSEQYVDIGEERQKMSDIIFLPTVAEFESLTKPKNGKVYYIVEDSSLHFYFNKQWKTLPYIDTSKFLAKDNEEEYTPIGDYNPATKKYVDEHAGNKLIYMLTFTEREWEQVGQQYHFTVLQREHKLPNPYISALEHSNGGSYSSVSIFGSKVLPNGNILIISDTAFDGRLILEGGQ